MNQKFITVKAKKEDFDEIGFEMIIKKSGILTIDPMGDESLIELISGKKIYVLDRFDDLKNRMGLNYFDPTTNI